MQIRPENASAADVFAAVTRRLPVDGRQPGIDPGPAGQLGQDVDPAAAQAALDQAIQAAGPAAGGRKSRPTSGTTGRCSRRGQAADRLAGGRVARVSAQLRSRVSRRARLALAWRWYAPSDHGGGIVECCAAARRQRPLAARLADTGTTALASQYRRRSLAGSVRARPADRQRPCSRRLDARLGRPRRRFGRAWPSPVRGRAGDQPAA